MGEDSSAPEAAVQVPVTIARNSAKAWVASNAAREQPSSASMVPMPGAIASASSHRVPGVVAAGARSTGRAHASCWRIGGNATISPGNSRR